MTMDLGKPYIIEGLPVYGDDDAPDLFYVFPKNPSIRVDEETKKPVFKFIKYSLPVDRPDGKKGGGFVIFDCVFAIPDDKLKKVQAALDSQIQHLKDAHGQPLKAKIAQVPYTDGTATFHMMDTTGVLVSKTDVDGKPSLFGAMNCPVAAELTEDGAHILSEAMKGSGPMANMTYDLHCPATFPPIKGSVTFNAVKTYAFYQSISKSGGGWGSSSSETDVMRQQFLSSDSGTVWFDFASLGYITDADARKKLQDDLTNWGNSQLEAAAKAMLLPDIKPTDDTGDHGKDRIVKSQSQLESASFVHTFSERMGVVHEVVLTGTLPSLKDMGFDFMDYYTEIPADDPFFATVQATLNVNAEFAKFGIQSVDVKCVYDKLASPTTKGFHFTKPDDIGKFDSNTANGDKHYNYSFIVNYLGQAKSYESPVITTDAPQLTISANDLGVLVVDMAIGNIDPTKIPLAQVTVSYPEPNANGEPINQQFTFDKDKKSDHLIAVLLKTVDKPITYQISYTLTDGTTVAMPPVTTTIHQISINSPFVTKKFTFAAEGDFTDGIDHILLKMKYTDAANKIEEETDYMFDGKNNLKEWEVPAVANSKGQLTYSGVITYKNHSSENIPETTATSDLITVGPANQVVMQVVPDTALIDFTKVLLVKVNFEYKDPAHQIDIKQEYVLKQNTPAPTWKFYPRDSSLTSYTWSAIFYMAGSPPKAVPVPPSTSSDTDLLITPPA